MPHMKRNLIAFSISMIGTVIAVIFIAFIVRPWHLSWGATAAEQRMMLGGDAFMSNVHYQSTRAISIDAPAREVFPWLVQMGQNKGGLYSYEMLENFAGCNMTNADRIHPEWQTTKKGDAFFMDARIPPLTVAIVDAPRAFVIYAGPDRSLHRHASKAAMPGNVAVSWSFNVMPFGDERSRLIIRWRSTWERSFFNDMVNGWMIEPIHFIMERGMLKGLRAVIR